MTGEPYKYIRGGSDDYILYSVGWDQKDDGGSVVQARSGKEVDTKQGDWVWSVSPTAPLPAKE
jgi:hypothetical protein